VECIPGQDGGIRAEIGGSVGKRDAVTIWKTPIRDD